MKFKKNPNTHRTYSNQDRTQYLHWPLTYNLTKTWAQPSEVKKVPKQRDCERVAHSFE